MSYSRYWWCVVSCCTNTSIKTPEKLFIRVPDEIKMRNVWLELAKRDPKTLSRKSRLYLCEDHFYLEQDMENYMEYKIMGSVKVIKMRPNTKPSRFCWLDDKMEDHPESIASSSVSDVHNFQNDKVDKAIQIQPLTTDKSTQVQALLKAYKSVQAKILPRFRSKATQTKIKTRDGCISPVNISAAIVTSPHIKVNEIGKPRTTGVTKSAKRKLSVLLEEESHNEPFATCFISCQDFSPSKYKPTSDSSLPEEFQKEDQKMYYQTTLSKIKKKSRLYLGIPKELYFLVDIIRRYTNANEEQILLCLTKLKLNRTFSQLSDDFGLSLSQANKIFLTKLPLISKLLSHFIKKCSPESITMNLPVSFRHPFQKVTCIIDCLELEIQKPSKAVRQALTWSEYKKAYTIKYLVSYTPDGLVSFVSPGYGGRISDINLVKHSNILDSLKPGACILADRRFKHIEPYLQQRNFTVIRVPSVNNCSKLTKSEFRPTKEIASLRIHVERVIHKIHEFGMLKLHTVVNTNLITVLDECVVTACALINIQNSLIK